MKLFKRILSQILIVTIIMFAVPFASALAEKSISNCKIALSQTSFFYTGYSITPDVTVYDGDRALVEYSDYIKSYDNNINIGTASVTVTGVGDYTGSQTLNFNIVLAPPANLSVTEALPTSLKISWENVTWANGYEIEKYNDRKKAYVKVAETSFNTSYEPNTFTDKNLKKLTMYKYRVRAYTLIENQKVYGVYSSVLKAYTSFQAPVLKLSTGNKKVKISWKKVALADGYEIYRITEDEMWNYWENDQSADDKYKRIKTVTKKTSYLNKKLKNKIAYFYKLRAFKIINGVKVYSQYSNTECSADANSRLNYAKLKSRNSIKMISTRSDVNSYTIGISKSDRKIMKKFVKDHFKKGMTRADKVDYLLDYIHNETNYIKTSAQWSKISGKSYIYDIFKLHLGQCAQYNGALAMFLAYLGYDARLVCGYRGYSPKNKWSHYWCEVKIDGVTYLMEAGNKKDGPWGFNCVIYYESDGKYIKNRKNCY